MTLEDRRIFAICRHVEAIGEALPELLSGQLVVIHGDPAPPVIGHHAQIIDAVGMVGMVMGEEHAVEPPDAHVEQLLAEVRRGVDKHIGRPLFTFPLHEHRAAPPPVLRVCRIARAPDIADTGHAAGRAAAEDGELERHAGDGIDAAERGTFLNRRKKLSVVACCDLRLAHTAHIREPPCGMHHIGGLVGPPAQGLRRKIRRIGLDQQPVERHVLGDVAQALRNS